MRTIRITLAMGALLAAGVPASAHPHVFVDARSEIVFDEQARISAIRQIWQFDDAFTAYAIQGLDADNNGEFSDEELAPLAQVNIESLQEFDFFTYLVTGEAEEAVAFEVPTEYWLEFYDGRLTLFYTLPLKEPVAPGPSTTLEVFDPEYFVAFVFTEDSPVSVAGTPAGCGATYHPPQELDTASAALLGSIPASQRDLPPELQQLTAGLSNVITVSCE